MSNQFDYVRNEFNWEYKMILIKINELIELCEEINKKYERILYHARYISTEAERFGETNTAEEFRELEQGLTEQYEKLPNCEVRLNSTMPVEVKKHVADLLHERKIFGHWDPDRVREIQKEIETILSQYDR